MKGINEDLRVKRTHKLLSDSLLSLMLNKPFEKISVKDICDKAMVHRTTFYSHFQDKYDLLEYCIKELEEPFDTTDITQNSFDGYKTYYMNVARSILNEVESNREVFAAMLRKNKDESFIANFQSALTKKLMDKFQKCIDNGLNLSLPISFLATFYSGACISVVSWWIENDTTMSADEIVECLDKLIRPSNL